VYGFVPYWEMDDTIAAHLAATDLTTLALFSITHQRNGHMVTDANGYRKITGELGHQLIREAHARGTRVEVVYSSFGRTKNQRFYNEPKARARWVGEIVDFVADHDLDGVNVDVESLPADDVEAYGAFVGQLREALRERDPKAEVTVATQGSARGTAMAVAAAAAGADRIFMMGYDYHWDGSEPGATSPLDSFDGKPSDLRTSLDRNAAAGVPAERTLLGLPLYGMTWPVVGPEIGALSTGRGDEWEPRLNLPVFQAPDFNPTLEPIQSVEFYAVEKPIGVEGAQGHATAAPSAPPGTTQWHAVYYDSPRSLTPKLKLADVRGLAGAGFWAIGFERGLPGYTELIHAFRSGTLQSPG
jgi:spore germination protein YaaH